MNTPPIAPVTALPVAPDDVITLDDYLEQRVPEDEVDPLGELPWGADGLRPPSGGLPFLLLRAVPMGLERGTAGDSPWTPREMPSRPPTTLLERRVRWEAAAVALLPGPSLDLERPRAVVPVQAEPIARPPGEPQAPVEPPAPNTSGESALGAAAVGSPPVLQRWVAERAAMPRASARMPVVPAPIPGSEAKIRGVYLQIPFANGVLSGQIEVSKSIVDFSQSPSLLLQADSAELQGHLRQHLDRSGLPAWRLADGEGGRQHLPRQGAEDESGEPWDEPPRGRRRKSWPG